MFSLAKIMKPVLGVVAGLTMLSAAAGFAAAEETRVVFVPMAKAAIPIGRLSRTEWTTRPRHSA
jgi:simple sugar transport system substrate-binding protein